jgi:hypothetical protein
MGAHFTARGRAEEDNPLRLGDAYDAADNLFKGFVRANAFLEH